MRQMAAASAEEKSAHVGSRGTASRQACQLLRHNGKAAPTALHSIREAENEITKALKLLKGQLSRNALLRRKLDDAIASGCISEPEAESTLTVRYSMTMSLDEGLRLLPE